MPRMPMISFRLRNIRSPQSDIVQTLGGGFTHAFRDCGVGKNNFGCTPAALAGFCFGDTLMIAVFIGGPVFSL